MIEIILDNSVRFKTEYLEKNKPDLLDKLIQRFTYDNPKYLENDKWGYSNQKVDRYLFSYSFDDSNGVITFTRGLYKYILRQFNVHSIPYKVKDKTLLLSEVDYSQSKVTCRPEQLDFSKALIKAKSGIALAFTSFGKSLTVLETIALVKQKAVIVVHTEFLQKQWIKEATDSNLFNLDKSRIGGCGGVFRGKARLGDINICLYHSLGTPSNLRLFKDSVGVIVADETQKLAIDAMHGSVNFFPAKYRWGVSANHTRKDKKEFLIEDTLGEVVYNAEEVDGDSKILADIHLLSTEYRDYDYEFDHQYSNLITRMSLDKTRNTNILRRVVKQVNNGLQCMILVERKEQACLLTSALTKKGIKTALLIGPLSKKSIKQFKSKAAQKVALEYDDKKAYDYVKKNAEAKKIQVIIGTQKAEVGLSVRTLNFGIVTTPMGSNVKDRLNQIVGRFERTHGSDLEKKYGVKPRPVVELLIDDKIRSFKRHRKAIKDFYGDRCYKIK